MSAVCLHNNFMDVFSSMLTLSLSPWFLDVSLQDRGVISSGAYQPPLGNRLQVLDLQQGRLRPLRVLTAPPPVQENMHGHHQQAAEAQLAECVGAAAAEPGQHHPNGRVTESRPRGWYAPRGLTRNLSGGNTELIYHR